MEITEIFKKYTDKVVQIQLFHRAVKQNAKNELVLLKQYEEHIDDPKQKTTPLSAHNMFFRTVIGESPYFYGYEVSSLEDKINAVALHKNKQFQWLLAETYETFEGFIEEAYAFAGYMDKNFWVKEDFGKKPTFRIRTRGERF